MLAVFLVFVVLVVDVLVVDVLVVIVLVIVIAVIAVFIVKAAASDHSWAFAPHKRESCRTARSFYRVTLVFAANRKKLALNYAN